MGKMKHSFVWLHFDQITVDKEKGTMGSRCRLCKSYTYVPKEGNSSTSALIGHLLNRHDIKDPAKVSRIQAEEKKKSLVQLEIFPFTGPNELKTYGEWVTIQAVVDGVSFNTIASSEFQRHAFKSMGMKPMLTAKGVAEVLMSHVGKLKESVKLQLAEDTKQGKKFSLIMDEWTNYNTRRYMAVLLTSHDKVYSLGLARCRGSMTAEAQLTIVKEQLKKFDMTIDALAGLGTDGASVMKAVGHLMPGKIHQLCHGKIIPPSL